MNSQVRESLIKSRTLLVIQNCGICRKWKEFIERFNLELPIEKRIKVIDCTNFNSLRVIDNSLLQIFDKYIPDQFPVLFLDGMRINWANSREECEAFVRGYLHKEFIIPRENPFMFNQKCKYIKRGFFGKKTLICSKEEED